MTLEETIISGIFTCIYIFIALRFVSVIIDKVIELINVNVEEFEDLTCHFDCRTCTEYCDGHTIEEYSIVKGVDKKKWK